MKKTVVALLACLGLLLMTGCNTVKGFGQDVQKVGEKLEGAAKK